MRIIHFSDFHLCGGDKIKQSIMIAKKLAKSFGEINCERQVDLVVFSGDLVDCGGASFPSITEGFKAFKEEVIDRILEACNISADRFIMVPGNHDFVNPEEDVMADLEGKTENADAVANVLCDDSFSVIPWMKDYKDFEKEYYVASNATYKMSPFQSIIIVDVDGKKVGIAMLNSAWRQFYPKKYNQVILGRHQVINAALDLEGCDVKLAVGHNHYDMLQEFEQYYVREALIANFDIFFSGHKHSDKPMFVKNNCGKLLNAITSGTKYGNESDVQEEYKNAFFVIDYEKDSETIVTRYEQISSTEDFERDKNYGYFKPETETYLVTAFMPIGNWTASYMPDCTYMKNDKIDEYIQAILDVNVRTLQIVALSGFGKTRMIYEAYASNEQARKDTFYATYSLEARDSIITEFRQILHDHQTKPCTVIIDNCPSKFLSEIDFMRGGNPYVRIITLDNNLYDVTTVGTSRLIKIERGILREEVDEYIDRSIPEDGYGSHFRAEIKKIADGFPKMAIDLVDVYNERKSVGISNVESLFDKLLIFPQDDKANMKACMQAMALFQPMPYGSHNAAYDFIRDNSIISNISGDHYQRRRVFKKTISRFEKHLIEIDGENLVVRPYPLAVWLSGQWFQEVDEEMIEDLLGELANLSNTDCHAYETLKEGLARRLEYMAENEYATEEVSQLLAGVKGFFRNEKVVCSDLGSRLFLAMSHVNPVAVGSCLWSVLNGKSAEWARLNIKGSVRRNLVWALEKVCFPSEGFADGAKLLALLSLGENEEKLGNNATQILNQLFHILLSGTAANLNERLSIIEYLKTNGYVELFVNAINNAFPSSDFIRTGSAQKFGAKELKDYHPTNDEVYDYWDGCKAIMIESLNNGFLTVEKAKGIVEKQAHQWIYRGLFEREAMPIINAIMEKCPSEWEGLYTIIKQNERSYGLKMFMKRQPEFIPNLISKIRPNHFVTNIKDLRTRIYDIRHNNFEDETKMIFDEYSKLANYFVEQGVYASSEEIRLIDEDMEYMNYNFPREIVSRLNDEQLQVFIDQFIAIYTVKGDDNEGCFYYGVADEIKNRNVKDYLLGKLFDLNLQKLYVCTLAIMENEDFANLNRLHKDVVEGRIDASLVSIYYLNIRNLSKEGFSRLVALSEDLFPNRDDDMLNLALRHRYSIDVKNDKETTGIVKRILLNYEIKEDNNRLNYQYSNLCISLIEAVHDKDFAIALNKKLINVLNQGISHSDFDILYNKLLLNYRDAIWQDVSTALVDKDHFVFYYNVKDSIGSGSGFGAGVLFQGRDDELKQLCRDYPATAPQRLASMCPVFTTDREDSFSDFYLWLLNEYGDNKDVLDSLDCNAHSFCWTGSVIPLYTHIRACYSSLLSHRRKGVRDWAETNVTRLDNEIGREKNREAYMRLHYE